MSQADYPSTGAAPAVPTGKIAQMSTGFLAALLAPLPAGEEAVASPAFRRQLERDLYADWNDGMDNVREAEAIHTIVAMQDRRSGIGISEKCLEAYQSASRVRWAQCLIPAPTPKELRWKQRAVKAMVVPPYVTAAIAADAARLAVLA